ncbi:hypothetical protein SARC_11058 [Sphaeroforma arctica JP610]|uniref:Uncharacterized protein n=1 Tax=Sphaeroforma arctica JP610 TaxID=667725 RepID=A0A0L0FIZ3_9EUKA|nr:hypothetical protein SARC_11058 [Sphaeroforma arctica JP610]KNC76441.1 hypothetical protein SARC_11058 [Sphaeroforma arctica JP610]|eukprot:XP_014150343.1 hypothetical protein SARC_11058 [Sphaeroforma arctica JP610]
MAGTPRGLKAGLFGLATMADAGGSDHALGERLGKYLDALMKHLAKVGLTSGGAPLQDYKAIDDAAQALREHLTKAAKMTTREGVIAGHTLECFLSPHASFYLGVMKIEPHQMYELDSVTQAHRVCVPLLLLVSFVA